MTGTDIYHAVPQSARIQKRLALNQGFKSVREGVGRGEPLTYVTFGGSDLHDVMDFLAVFDVRDHRLSIISYEENQDVAQQSQSCPIAATLSQIDTIRITIVPVPFFEQDGPLQESRDQGRFIYFLDDTKPFAAIQANKIGELLKSNLLRDGDYVLVSSCITPRIMHQATYLQDKIETFRLFFGAECTIDRDFKIRNHVDLFFGLLFSGHDRFAEINGGTMHKLRPRRLRKFRYKDTRAGMALWVFRVERATLRTVRLTDEEFEDFPMSFAYRESTPGDIPDLFDDLS